MCCKIPSVAAALIRRHTPSLCERELFILDAGAGDGLTGLSLRKAGFANSDITGIDLSRDMLKKATNRKCYNRTQVSDLNLPLDSFPTDTFDIVQCIGTLTYVSPEAGTLAEFVRITKSGGLVCYSNRTDKLEQWKETEESLSSKWTLLEIVGPMPYLPHNPEFGERVQVVVYLFQVL